MSNDYPNFYNQFPPNYNLKDYKLVWVCPYCGESKPESETSPLCCHELHSNLTYMDKDGNYFIEECSFEGMVK